MQVSSVVSIPSSVDVHVLVFNGVQSINNQRHYLGENHKLVIQSLEKNDDFPQKGKSLLLPFFEDESARFVLLYHVDGNDKSLKKMAKDLSLMIEDHQWKKIILDVPCSAGAEKQTCKTIISAMYQQMYRFTQFKSENQTGRSEIEISWVCTGEVQGDIDLVLAETKAIASGINLAKDLGNMPPNVCTPSYLAEKAKALAVQYSTIVAEILEKETMEKLGMGALLAVAKGSVQAPKLIKIEYKPDHAINSQPIILVGKGVTFDAGGISLKPAAAMDLMKYDMGGAASVFGVIEAIATANLKVHVIAIVPAVENLPDGNAVKPGDIVRSYSGKTIEILNTDAEGRLILCDALSYAQQFNPECIIDIATLTGACVVALGSPRAGLFGNDQVLIEALYQAGEIADDKAWHLPLDEEYVEMLKSPFADVANIGSSRDAGAITAAGFLSLFTKEMKWAHLDIAGVAWNSSGPQKGGTGRPVSLLFHFLKDRETQHS